MDLRKMEGLHSVRHRSKSQRTQRQRSGHMVKTIFTTDCEINPFLFPNTYPIHESMFRDHSRRDVKDERCPEVPASWGRCDFYILLLPPGRMIAINNKNSHIHPMSVGYSWAASSPAASSSMHLARVSHFLYANLSLCYDFMFCWLIKNSTQTAESIQVTEETQHLRILDTEWNCKPCR